MKIVCDSCGTKYSISDDKVRGKVFKIRCKKCSHIIVVRGTSDAAAAPAAVDGGWHLVVDGDQVGPIPEAEIRAKLERGEINGETYVWKEGFADWLKLSAVPEFAGVVGGAGMVADASAPVATNGADGSGRQRSGPSGLFGTVDAPATGGESDVFAAPAPAAARGGGGDLFASPAAQEQPRWPASGGGGAAVGASGHDGGRVENLTGQRHENSVLFSLANLQSLAMPQAAAKPLTNTAPTSEGSGLIDIRAMAATTLGAPGDARLPSFGGGGGSGDDLPAFGAFSPAAPVLLPLPSSSGPPKWVYLMIGAMVLLVFGIGFMAYKIISAKPPTVVTETVQVPVPAPPAAGTKPSAAVAAAGEGTKATSIPDEKLPPREAAKTEGSGEGKSEKSAERRHGGGSGSRKDKGEKKGGSGDDKKALAAAPAAPAEKEKEKPPKDSLEALLRAASSTRESRSDDGPKKGADSSASAGPISRTAVVSGMKAVTPKVNECYSQYKVPGQALVNIVIAKNGKVTSASVTGKFAGTPTGACVERAVKTASFPASDGLTTMYPFLLK